MQEMSVQQVESVLSGARPGDEIFVSYLAGLPPTDRAVREAGKARDLGFSARWLEGRVERVAVNARGETYATVFTYTRYDERRPEAEGHYRSFNASVGRVLSLALVSGGSC